MFSRASRAAGRHHRDDRDDRSGRKPDHGRRSLADDLSVTDDEEGSAAPAASAPPDPRGGPYDISEAPAGVPRLDLGSLKIPSVPGVEVRVQANPDGQVTQVYLVHGESALQLGVFAAPRTEPIWDEVREEIRKALFADGVAAEEVAGEYGTELRARVRTQQGLKDLRFVGVSGPRWLARAVYQGPAAVDPASAGPLAECLRSVVVDRGDEAKPVKEPLPLRLSGELAGQLRGPDGAAPAPVSGAASPVNGAVPAFDGSAPPPGGPASTSSPSPRAGGSPPADGSAPPRRKPSPRPRRD